MSVFECISAAGSRETLSPTKGGTGTKISFSNTLKYTQTPKYTQILSNTLKYFQIHSNTLKYTQIHSNTLKYTQIQSNTHWVWRPRGREPRPRRECRDRSCCCLRVATSCSSQALVWSGDLFSEWEEEALEDEGGVVRDLMDS